MAARFEISPSVPGQIRWPTDRRLVFRHQTLRTDSEYRVTLRAGYRSLDGGATDLEHTWTFKTEEALQVVDWAPGPGDRGVDPAAYLAITCNHRLAAAGLASAFALDPATPVDAHLDATDPQRILVAPRGLLVPDQSYTLRVLRSLRDIDGNALPQPASVTFQTGPPRPLHGWVTYLQTPADSLPGTAGSLWMVNANRLPRLLAPPPVLAYAWSPGGDELTLETAPRTWADLPLGGTPAPLSVAADWLAPLGPARGFAFLDGGTLGLLTPAGERVDLARGVQAAALSPDGTQIAYTEAGATGTEIWAIVLELRSRFRVQVEAGTVTGLAWSPDEGRLAYQRSIGAEDSIQVRALDQGTPAAVVDGQVSDPAWDADSQHLFVLGLSGSPLRARIYRLPVAGGPQALGGSAMPDGSSRDAGPPVVAPDGHQVAFLSSAGVWLMNADGTGLARLTPSGYSCSEPLWTPA